MLCKVAQVNCYDVIIQLMTSQHVQEPVTSLLRHLEVVGFSLMYILVILEIHLLSIILWGQLGVKKRPCL